MKYIYIVTRNVHPTVEGITEIPNLGVHSSELRAREHFVSVVQNREKSDEVKRMEFNQPFFNDSPYVVIMEAWCKRKNGQSEHIHLEKWKVK